MRTANRHLAIVAAALAFGALSNAPAYAASERLALELQYPIGAMVIVNDERKLYYVVSKTEVVRYPVAVGKTEELWLGRTFVANKKVDPRWVPVDGSDEVEGGEPDNPLGKRALYLDWSLLRIHGTPARKSIGSATSNGCIRMLNEDVIELYDMVHLGAPVFAIQTLHAPTKYKTVKFAEKIYVNQEARDNKDD